MEDEEMRCVEADRRDPTTAKEKDLLIPGLPNEIAILCIARVPRASHRSISGVCVSWRNLVHGREFLKVRRELSLAEEWLYLWTDTENAWRCFDVSLNKWSKLPAMPHDDRAVGTSGVASIDGNIFVIGGFLSSCSSRDSCYWSNSSSIPSTIVSSFDTRSYSWKRVADLNVARAHCMTGVIGNLIYVFGGFIDTTTRIAEAEVYDPSTDRWRLISSMISPVTMSPNVVMGGRFHAKTWGRFENHVMYDPKGVMYDPLEDKWEHVSNGLDGQWHTTTVLDGKLYALGDYFLTGNLEDEYEPQGVDEFMHVYDPSRNVWEMVDEIFDADSPMHLIGNVEVVTFCGKLCVVSVESFGFATENTVSTINIVMLDVKEFQGHPTCSVTFRGEFELQSEEERRELLQVKKCQVVAL